MNYEVVTNPNRITLDQWKSFLLEHDKSNVFHVPEVFYAINNSPKNDSYFFGVTENGKLRALMTAYVSYDFSYQPFKYLSSRAVIYGDPLYDYNDLELLNLLIQSYIKKLHSNVVYTQIRNFNEQNEASKKVFESFGFQFEEHLNILIDLTKTEEILWKEVNSTRRKQIRRSINRGTTFKLMDSQGELKESYNILMGVYKRAKLPLPSYEYFLELFKTGSSMAKLLNFVAMYNGQIIGCRFILAYKDRLFDFFAGAKTEYYSKYPNDLIPWEVIKWGGRSGYKVFDFGGAGKPNIPYGVRDYKEKFGGQMVNYGRYEKNHNKFVLKISTIGFNMIRKIRYGIQ